MGVPPSMSDGKRGDRMSYTRSELLAELRVVSPSPRKAKQALDRATGMVGLSRNERLSDADLLLLCEALASEGGAVRVRAEEIAEELVRTSVGEPSNPEAA